MLKNLQLFQKYHENTWVFIEINNKFEIFLKNENFGIRSKTSYIMKRDIRDNITQTDD
jgi:hypothetical protein